MSDLLVRRPASPPRPATAAGLWALLRDVAVPDDCAIAAGDSESFDAVRAREYRCWLPVQAEPGWVLIGPAVQRGRPGCPTCLGRRRDGNRADTAARQTLAFQALSREPRLLPMVSALIAALVRAEMTRGFPRTTGGVLRVSTRTAVVRQHRLIADPLCPDCGHLTDDQPSRLRLESAPKLSVAAFRVRELSADLEVRYVDAETGLIGSIGVGVQGQVSVAVARLMPGRAGDDSRHGYGRALDASSARAIAVAEALERHASARPRDSRPAIRARYRDIADHALDPRSLGLYPDQWYGQPDFGCARFDEDQEAAWVWGHSFAADRPILVPLHLAYHSALPRGDARWAHETSNGVAVGGCLPEAIFHGLLEIAERDAFLMTWYGRLPVPKVDLAGATDRQIALLAAKTRRDLGYELMAFAMPMEQRIPAFWVMAVDRSGASGRPYALCAAGAHADPVRALRSAVLELLPILANAVSRYDEQASAALLADADAVTKMEDHQRLYAHPGAFGRLGFLPAEGRGLALEELADSWPPYADLTEDLAELVGRYLATGLDVIAVDITGPELRDGGFAAAKVLVPGTLPMTFGHRYRRTHGLPRLFSVPRLLGYRDHDLSRAELNPYPHPFP
jgi:ribosomal protein S12 methylthiotransferase accessory factor